MVDDRLWDPVLGWAAVHPAGEETEVLDAAVPAIDAFLVGASAFGLAATVALALGRLRRAAPAARRSRA